MSGAFNHNNLSYHPSWGYKSVGSTCIQHLTREDKNLSGKLLNLYRVISSFVHDSDWSVGYTKNGKKYIKAKYNHNVIRVYGSEGRYSFQLALKIKGEKWYDYRDYVRLKNKSLDEAKELSYIALRGVLSSDDKEVSILRSLYKSIR